MQALPVSAKPPYQVLCYTLQNTMAPASSLTDTGQGAAINWTTDVPWNDLTMVADAFYEPKINNSFTNQGAKGSVLINAAHAQSERCIVSLGGAGQDGAFPTLCGSAATRTAFASAVTAMIASDGYDGVDIDWETTGAATQTNATAMMQVLYTAIKALPNCSVDGQPHTLAFTTNPLYSTIFNMTTLGICTDWCLFMGYDWYDTPATYANGPLNGVSPSCVSSITGMTNGTQWSYPISKMILGCPLYTNDYNAGTEIDTLSILHLGTAGIYNTSYAEQAYTTSGDTVYVDTAQSYCDKINWAIHAGLMGIGMWDMGQGLPATDSMMTAIWNTIGGNSSCLTVVGPTNTPTSAHTATPSATFTNTASKTATYTATSTTASMTFTNTVIHSNTPTITNTQMNTNSATVTNTETLSPTNSPTITDTSTNTPSMTVTNTPPLTATFINTPVITSTFTLTPIITATFTNTLVSISTPTHTSTATATNSFTNTNTSTFTTIRTQVNTSTSTWTVTSAYTATPTPVLAVCPGVPVWSGTQVAYGLGQEVGYNGELYVCLQFHTSSSGLIPSTQPSLWKNMGPCGSTPTNALVASPVVFPNPITSTTATLQLPMSNVANVKVQVFTTGFRKVQTVTEAQVMGDTMAISIMDKSGKCFANGLYYFVIYANGQRWVHKVLVLR